MSDEHWTAPMTVDALRAEVASLTTEVERMRAERDLERGAVAKLKGLLTEALDGWTAAEDWQHTEHCTRSHSAEACRPDRIAEIRREAGLT
jgi:hypothetical protein